MYIIYHRQLPCTIYLGKFHDDLTAAEPWKSLVKKGNHPLMAARFRLANYDNLPI